MAKAWRGIFRGKVANVVFTTWKGIPVIRSKPGPNKSSSPAQLLQRKRFSVVKQFVGDIKPVINAGFKWNTERMTEQNSATSYNMKRALKGDTIEEIAIDYPQVLVARGDLSGPQGGTAGVNPQGNITFSWDFEAKEGGRRAKDKMLALAYCPAIRRGFYKVDGSVRRKDGEYTLELPEECAGQEMETYLAFTTEDGEEASNSVYLGRIVV